MRLFNDFSPVSSCRLIMGVILLTVVLIPAAVSAAERPEVPEIAVNRTNLNFGAIKDGNSTSTMTDPQSLLISNDGGGTLEWAVTDDVDWLICSPTSGKGSGRVNVAVAPCGLPAGTYYGTLQVDSPYASNSPQIVPVVLDVKNPSQDQPPFGTFETPLQNSTVRSSIPVTGWVLDDVAVDNVKIYNGSNYVGDAVFVEGARPDVEASYPYYPANYQAGWGYMMLTNFLPNGGNGTYHLSAVATDSEGQQTTLGTKTIHCDNEHAVKPFGAIDAPSQGGSASGSSYVNWGWALTPQPNHIPTDGSTINVYVDGVNTGHPHYNVYREDIAGLFPDLANSDGAVGYFYFDTTGYADGVHTIQWTARDSGGNSDGIGSRYFTINNTGNRIPGTTASQSRNTSRLATNLLTDFPSQPRAAVRLREGFAEKGQPQVLFPDSEGLIHLQMKELGRIELDLFHAFTANQGISGFLAVGNQLRPLPIGSTLSSSQGKFYWMPGPAFLGTYHLVFFATDEFGGVNRQDVMVTISPGIK